MFGVENETNAIAMQPRFSIDRRTLIYVALGIGIFIVAAITADEWYKYFEGEYAGLTEAELVDEYDDAIKCLNDAVRSGDQEAIDECKTQIKAIKERLAELEESGNDAD